jgi:coenzyme Q-binding protein COQ10
MPDFKTTRRVPYTPQQMFALVADVETYPSFLPLCEALTILSRMPRPGGETIVADMQVGYGPIRETFRSKVTLDPAAPAVRAESIAGPFSHMTNHWTFTPAPGGGCDVGFGLSYAFKSPLLQMLVGSMFETAFRRYAEAFERRARAVYGTNRTPVA